jgi:hypothetical protein
MAKIKTRAGPDDLGPLERMTVEMEVSTHQQIRALAKHYDESIATMVRSLLARGIAHWDCGEMPKSLAPQAEVRRVRVPGDLYAKLQHKARLNDNSIHSMMVEALRAGIDMIAVHE